MRDKIIKIGQRKIHVPWNAVDQAVDYFSPVRGDQRYASRVRAAAVSGGGGYNAADRSRSANVHGHKNEMDADSALLPNLESLRADSQDLARNNPIACGVLSAVPGRVIGKGLFPKPRVDRAVLNLSDEQADKFEDAAEREYLRVTETREIDAERQLSLSLIQNVVFYSVLRDGDLLVNLPRFSRPGSDALLKLQLIQAARLSNPNGKQDTRRLVCGVGKDSTGGPERYHVASRHPGNRKYWSIRAGKGKVQWKSIDAFDSDGSPLVLHPFDKKEPGQTRGIPYLAPVIESLRQLGRYSDAELMAAVISGMFAVIVRSQSGSPEFQARYDADGDDADSGAVASGLNDINLEGGTVVGIPDGKDISIAESKRPNKDFAPFYDAIVQQVAVALEIPKEWLMKLFESSYSASRAALEELWSFVQRRRAWMVKIFCQPIYELVIAEAVAFGRLSAPGFYSSPVIRSAWCGAQWQGDVKPQIDELKTVKASVERIESRISTIDEECRMLTGIPLADKIPQMVRERRILREANLDPDVVFTGNAGNAGNTGGSEG